MRKIVLISGILTVLLTTSCTKKTKNNPEIVGNWQLIEVLSDPGDGSGTFNEVDSNKSIIFKENETFIASGDMCSMFSLIQINSVGTYSIDSHTITPNNCSENPLHYTIVDGKLIVSYFCDEACQEKYRKFLTE